MRSFTTLALLLLTISAPAAAATTREWPGWRGPERNALSHETGLIDTWSDDGPPLLWSADVGAGYSSVVVADDRAFTLGDIDGAQRLLGLDARTGRELWRHELGAPFASSYGDGPRSTPLVDGKLVFAIGTQGRLAAVEADSGKQVWQRDLVQSFGARLPTYGFSSSPLVAGRLLFLEAGGKDAAFVALDKRTGKTVWASQNDLPAYSSPVATEFHGVQQIVFWSAHGLRALAADDGTLLWKHDTETLCPASGDPLNTGTPILVGDDRLFISSGAGASLLQIDHSETGFAVRRVWHTERMRSDVNTAVAVGRTVYGFNRGILQAVDVDTGGVRWQARGFQRGSLIAADGRLIVLGEKGNLALVDASPEEFRQRAVVQVLDGRNWTSPSLADGRLYLRSNQKLLCLDLRERKEK